MADNYLEKKMEEWREKPSAKKGKGVGSLTRLITKNRSHRGYDPTFKVRRDQLLRLVEVNTRIPSARNGQVLRFRAVLEDEADKVLPHIRLGGALPHLRLPLKGQEPRAFIVICATCEEDRYVSIDLGISVQTMLLQAVEIGLNGICIGAFDREAVRSSLNLPYSPLLILAIGKGIDKIELVPISASEPHTYYRENGVHYVPKVKAEELLIE